MEWLVGAFFAALFFLILYQVIRAAVREGYLEAQRFLRGEEATPGEEDEAVYRMQQELETRERQRRREDLMRRYMVWEAEGGDRAEGDALLHALHQLGEEIE